MRDQGTRVRHEIILSPVRIYSTQAVEAAALEMHKATEPRIADHFDGWEIRHMIRGWGQTSRIELTCPASWWQHLKLALRTRWPRLFGRLVVRLEEKIAENGAIVTGLSAKLSGGHLVIPYHVPVSSRFYTDDPSQPEDA